MKLLAALATLFVVLVAPLAWLYMLHSGNTSPLVGLSFWGAVPAGTILALIIASVGSAGSVYLIDS